MACDEQISNFTMLVYKYKICRYIQFMQTDMLFIQLIAPFTAQWGVLSAHGRLDKSYSCITHNIHNAKSNLFMHIKQCNDINMVST